jgi:Tol biopolymer transport system component
MKKYIVIASLLLCFGFGLYAQPKAAGEPRVIARTNEPLQTPVWSSDGTKLSFTSLKNNGLWEVSSNGTNLRQVSDEAGAGNQLRALSADNTPPLFKKMVDNPAQATCQIEALESLKDYLIFNPAVSPAGDRIVFQVSNGQGLYICNADGSGLRSLGKGERATWTPDGRYIVVMQIEDDGEVVTKGELISIHVASGARSTLLSSDKYIALSPAISPDGKKLAFEEYASGAIYIMDIQ